MSTRRFSTSRWSLPASSSPPAWYWDGKCPRAGARNEGRTAGSGAGGEHQGPSERGWRELRGWGGWSCRGAVAEALGGEQGGHSTCITAVHHLYGSRSLQASGVVHD